MYFIVHAAFVRIKLMMMMMMIKIRKSPVGRYRWNSAAGDETTQQSWVHCIMARCAAET